MAEANGQSLPLGFIFAVGTDGTAEEGAKSRLLDDFLEYFVTRCPNIKFTLTDKERSEINTCRKKLPDAKHQCCWWHGTRYVQLRLSEDKATAPYDPRCAHRKFDFIDPTWCPGVVASAAAARAEMESGCAVNRTEEDEEAEVEEDEEVRWW